MATFSRKTFPGGLRVRALEIPRDLDTVLMKPEDTPIVCGTNHAWSNNSIEPCLPVGSMIDAIPNAESHN